MSQLRTGFRLSISPQNASRTASPPLSAYAPLPFGRCSRPAVSPPQIENWPWGQEWGRKDAKKHLEWTQILDEKNRQLQRCRMRRYRCSANFLWGWLFCLRRPAAEAQHHSHRSSKIVLVSRQANDCTDFMLRQEIVCLPRAQRDRAARMENVGLGRNICVSNAFILGLFMCVRAEIECVSAAAGRRESRANPLASRIRC